MGCETGLGGCETVCLGGCETGLGGCETCLGGCETGLGGCETGLGGCETVRLGAASMLRNSQTFLSTSVRLPKYVWQFSRTNVYPSSSVYFLETFSHPKVISKRPKSNLEFIIVITFFLFSSVTHSSLQDESCKPKSLHQDSCSKGL